MVRPRPCTGYTYTVVYPVPGRVYGPCTWPVNGRVRGPYTAVNGRVGGQPPCTRVVSTPVYMTAVYGQAVIRACARVMGAPCARPCTAVFTVRTRSWSCAVILFASMASDLVDIRRTWLRCYRHRGRGDSSWMLGPCYIRLQLGLRASGNLPVSYVLTGNLPPINYR